LHSQGSILFNILFSKTDENFISINPAYKNASLKDNGYVIHSWAATAAATTIEAEAGGCDGPVPKQAAAAAGASGLAKHDEDLASSAGQHEPVAEQAAGPSRGTAHDATVQLTATTDDAGASLAPKHDDARGAGHGAVAEQAAGPSSGTAHDAAVQRAASTDDAGASLAPKHDHARGARHGPVAGGDEEQQRAARQQEDKQQRAAQQQEKEQQRAAQQQEEEQLCEAQRVAASGAGFWAGGGDRGSDGERSSGGWVRRAGPKAGRGENVRGRDEDLASSAV